MISKKQVTVINNTGAIQVGHLSFTNKCFYICLVKGLKSIGVNTDVVQLMCMFNDFSLDGEFNIDEEKIDKQFSSFFHSYPNVKIAIYSDLGNYQVDTQHCIEIVNGISTSTSTINILKCKHFHFEYITDFHDANDNQLIPKKKKYTAFNNPITSDSVPIDQELYEKWCYRAHSIASEPISYENESYIEKCYRRYNML